MHKLLIYIQEYFRELDKPVFIITALFTAALVFLNYRYELEKKLCYNGLPFANLWGHYILYVVAFTVPYLFYWLFSGRNHFSSKPALLLIFGAPLIFAFIVGIDTNLSVLKDPLWNNYLNQILYHPVRVLALTSILFVIWRMFYPEDSFFGMDNSKIEWSPYFLMLIGMVPLIAIAATQSDFLAMYPRVERLVVLPEAIQNTFWYKMLYEFSYGFSFFNVELFFRGFLILAFMKYVGKDAILPMACFYCAVHFGKPLGECISSFFGGMLLGIFVYNTGSIWGGLIVHLGIAWMMELVPILFRKA